MLQVSELNFLTQEQNKMKLSQSYKKNKPLIQWIVISTLIGLIGIIASIQLVGRVLATRAEMAEVKDEIERLQDRYSKLESLEETFDDNDTASIIQALPVRNSLLLALSQAKSIANKNEMVLSEIIGSPPQLNEATQVSTALLEYEVQGSLDNTLSFLEELSQSLPVVTIDELSLTKSSTAGIDISTKINVRVFWSDLPQELPTINEPIATLSEEELAFIEEMAARIAPSYSQSQSELEFSENAGRSNPFSSEVIIPVGGI